jgi:hypothetical protein
LNNSNCIEISNIPLAYEGQTDLLTRLLKMFGNFTQYETKVQASLGTLLCYCEYEQDDQVNKALHGFQDLLVKDQKLNVRRLHHSQASQVFTNLIS